MIQTKMRDMQPHAGSTPSLRSPRLCTWDTGHGCGCPQTLELSESPVSKHQQEGEAPTAGNTQGTLRGVVYQFWVLGEPCLWLRSGVPGVHVQPHTPTQVITHSRQGYPRTLGEPGMGPRRALQCPEGCLLPGLLASYTCHDDTV